MREKILKALIYSVVIITPLIVVPGIIHPFTLPKVVYFFIDIKNRKREIFSKPSFAVEYTAGKFFHCADYKRSVGRLAVAEFPREPGQDDWHRHVLPSLLFFSSFKGCF